MSQRKVVIAVSGGVAHIVSAPDDVDVVINDYDDMDEEGTYACDNCHLGHLPEEQVHHCGYCQETFCDLCRAAHVTNEVTEACFQRTDAKVAQ
jgi:hypothetical protein